VKRHKYVGQQGRDCRNEEDQIRGFGWSETCALQGRCIALKVDVFNLFCHPLEEGRKGPAQCQYSYGLRWSCRKLTRKSQIRL